MRDSLRSRKRGLLATRVRPGGDAGEVAVHRSWIEEGAGTTAAVPWDGPPLKTPDLAAVLRDGLPILSRPDDESGGVSFDFLEPLAPLPRLLIAGAGHIGQALCRLAVPLGFEVTVIDDRADFASSGRFPDADRLVVDPPGRALGSLPADADTYIVIVTRGHKDDTNALRACIRSRAAYIGMIGSRGKVALVRERFLVEGWASAAEFDRVHTPIGLPIGSRTVEEIAVSIAAELVQVRSRLSAGPRPG